MQACLIACGRQVLLGHCLRVGAPAFHLCHLPCVWTAERCTHAPSTAARVLDMVPHLAASLCCACAVLWRTLRRGGQGRVAACRLFPTDRRPALTMPRCAPRSVQVCRRGAGRDADAAGPDHAEPRAGPGRVVAHGGAARRPPGPRAPDRDRLPDLGGLHRSHRHVTDAHSGKVPCNVPHQRIPFVSYVGRLAPCPANAWIYLRLVIRLSNLPRRMQAYSVHHIVFFFFRHQSDGRLHAPGVRRGPNMCKP